MSDKGSGQLKKIGHFHTSKIISTVAILFAEYTQFGNFFFYIFYYPTFIPSPF